MKRLALLVPLVFANLGQAPAVKGGTLTGTIRIVQKGKVIPFTDAYVYLERVTAESAIVGRGVTANVEQRDRDFDPKITVIPRGAEIFFPNRDNENHSVFSPAAKANFWAGFDQGTYPPNQVGKSRRFSELGQFDIYCDVHKDMTAKVKVVPTRLFAKVIDGKFTLTDVPPAAYKVVAWAPDSNESRGAQALDVPVGATVTAETLNVQYTPKGTAHTRFDGSPYDSYSR